MRITIPIDIIILEYFDESIEAMRTLAKATPDGGEVMDLVTPISDKAKQQARDKYGLKTDIIHFKNPT